MVAVGVVDGSFGTHKCDDGADAERGGWREMAQGSAGRKECTGSGSANNYYKEKSKLALGNGVM
jgi:hypothetical protein